MKIIKKILFYLIFFGLSILLIAYARGYRLDLKNRSLTSKGIISLTSNPKTAKIYLNNDFKGVTDTNLTLNPGIYQIEIKKEGYNNWKKQVVLKGELVVNIDATLFPINPSLSPITNLGIIKATPLDNSDKILIFSEEGIYLVEALRKPINLFPNLKVLVNKNFLPQDLDIEKSSVYISPDLKQALIDNYLISLEEENNDILNFKITDESKENLLLAWQKKQEKDIKKILETYPKEFQKIASESFKIISFSPNETKVLYQSLDNLELPIFIKPRLIGTNQTKESRQLKKHLIYVYDKKEDKNYLIGEFQLEQIQWYFNSKHLVINNKNKILITDYDNTNYQTIYSGPYEKSFFHSLSDGNLLILANLNPEANKYPDLYVVGIR